MKNIIENKMFAELKTRSFLGQLYSEYFLYPKITTYLSGHLLDYGAGIGAYSSYYEKKRGRVTSAEVNFKCIEYMKTINLKPITIVNNSLESVDSIYDSVLLDNVLEHVDDPVKVIKEISRVTKINKNIVIGVPGVKGFNLDWDHKSFFDETEIKKICKSLDLKINEFFYMPLFKSTFLSLNLRQYCIYAVIQNSK
jgi:SAM-dependent methyltransferase